MEVYSLNRISKKISAYVGTVWASWTVKVETLTIEIEFGPGLGTHLCELGPYRYYQRCKHWQFN